MPLHLMFCRRHAVDPGVFVDEREILSLLLGESRFLLPSAVIRAEDIHHLPALKNNDVFPRSVIACFNQPLPLSFALLLEFTDSVFTEIHLVTTVAEIG